MRYVVAVSGGVDSVVLLDKMVRQYGESELVVAHFDHGIRPDSADDALFVEKLAKKYGTTFVTRREELGAAASEELARDRRYKFLRGVAAQYGAVLLTAHHRDDMIETIAINLTRGTGWRGLAVLASPDIERPLLAMHKAELLAYAETHKLAWREDATNSDTKYLRNALRQKLTSLDDGTKQLIGLYWERQRYLAQAIDREVGELVGQTPYSRYLLITAGDTAAHELLRAIILRESEVTPTRPQLLQSLLAIKTYAPSKSFEVARGVTLRFTRTTFVVEVAPPVLS